MIGAEQVVIVQSPYYGNVALNRRTDYGRGQLVVDILKVYNVGLEILDCHYGRFSTMRALG